MADWVERVHPGNMPIINTDMPPGGFPIQAELEARHCLPASSFIDLAGCRIHYADEGAGPTILLLHGSYANLRQWDAWAEGLKPRFRVVRFDWPASGLSDPDPAGDYGADRKVDLIKALADKLGISQFVLVGTSSAGVPAAALAATRPDRLHGLVLNNIAVGPLDHDENALPPALKRLIQEEAAHPQWHSVAFWREVLRANYADPTRVSEEVALRWTELNNRQFPGAMLPDPADTAAEFARTPGDLARIVTPTLVLWSDKDPETPLEREGRRVIELLGTADKELVVVPDCGHMMPDEAGARSLALLLPFLTRLTGTARA